MPHPLEKVESNSLINKEFSKEILINTLLLESSDIYDLLPRVETTRHLPSIHGLNQRPPTCGPPTIFLWPARSLINYIRYSKQKYIENF